MAPSIQLAGVLAVVAVAGFALWFFWLRWRGYYIYYNPSDAYGWPDYCWGPYKTQTDAQDEALEHGTNYFEIHPSGRRPDPREYKLERPW